MKIFTGVVPFSNCALVTSVTHIIKGKRPPRPADPVLTDDLWALMQGCWNQEPILRPQMSEVLKKVPGSISKRFRGFSKSSPEFRLALERFFDSTEYKDCITYLQDAALEEFVDFLDDVRRQTFITSAASILDFDLSFRYYISRDYLENYLYAHCITSGRYAVIGSHFRGLSLFLVRFRN